LAFSKVEVTSELIAGLEAEVENRAVPNDLPVSTPVNAPTDRTEIIEQQLKKGR